MKMNVQQIIIWCLLLGNSIHGMENGFIEKEDRITEAIDTAQEELKQLDVRLQDLKIEEEEIKQAIEIAQRNSPEAWFEEKLGKLSFEGNVEKIKKFVLDNTKFINQAHLLPSIISSPVLHLIDEKFVQFILDTIEYNVNDISQALINSIGIIALGSSDSVENHPGINIIKLLLAHGANPNFSTEYGDTPIRRAMKLFRHIPTVATEVIRLLTEKGANLG